MNLTNSFARTNLNQRCTCSVGCKQRKMSESQTKQILNVNGPYFNFQHGRSSISRLTRIGRDRWTVSSKFMFVVLLTLLLLSAGLASAARDADQKRESRHHDLHKIRGHHERPKTYLNEFAVNLKKGSPEEATRLALKYGFINKGQV